MPENDQHGPAAARLLAELDAEATRSEPIRRDAERVATLRTRQFVAPETDAVPGRRRGRPSARSVGQ
jgi:hypothetical protein